MPGLIQGLEIARRALLAHQSAMTVTGNNVANVSTPGYTRREAVLRSQGGERTALGVLGAGVRMDGVRRDRNLFLDGQLRRESALAHRWDARSSGLSRLEEIFNEPSDTGIAAALDRFFNSWLELSNQPEDVTLRTMVVQQGEALAGSIREADGRLRDQISTHNEEIARRVEGINLRLQEVAGLNTEIIRSEAGGGIAADLRDRRDLILDELAGQAGASHLERADGSVVVRLGGRTVVESGEVSTLAVERRNSGDLSRVEVVFARDGESPTELSGALGGQLEVNREVIPALRDQLDQLAATLIDRVNRVHAAGPSGASFFAGRSAGEIRVDPTVAADPGLIDAGSSGDPGDNDIALAVAALRDAGLLQRGTATFGGFYRGLVAGVGAQSEQADRMHAGQTAAVDALENERQSTMGVNLDEEMMRLVESQKAYEAAARVFTSTSDMLDVLLQI